MEVLKYLKNHTIEQLEEELSIIVKRYDDRITLNYNQIDSPKHHPIVKECRGLILSYPDYKVLARSFDRFFNYLEDPCHKEFDITKALVFKKLDGSLISIYFDGKEWQIATRKTAFGEAQTPLGNTYKSLVEKVLRESVHTFFKRTGMQTAYTHVFEYTSPENRIVTRYSEPGLHLLNVRHNLSGVDMPAGEQKQIAEELKIPTAPVYTFETIEKIEEALKDLPVLEEGYVCYIPEQQWRIKIKNPSYLAVAHIRVNGVISAKRIIFLVCDQDHEEYLSKFEEDEPLFRPYINAFNYMLGYVAAMKKTCMHIQDRKEFALAVKGPAQHIMFGLKDGKKLYEMIDLITMNAKERFLEAFVKEMSKGE